MALESVLTEKAQMPTHPLISVIIPAFNEEQTLSNVVYNAKKTLERMGHAYEIIVVDDGSTDQTHKIAFEEDVIIIRNRRNQGKGCALKAGLHSCRGDIIVTMDADGSHQPHELPELIRPIVKNQSDMIIGSRFKGRLENGAIRRMNMIGNRLFNAVIFMLSGKLLTDTQSGYRAFSRRALSNLNVNSTGYEIESEITVELILKGFRIEEVPIDCVCPLRNPRLRVFHDGYKILKTIFRTTLRWM
jgi:glycosyltransferase involved in cell wall biosynthesis